MRLVRIVAAAGCAAAVLGGLLGIGLARRLVLPSAARTVHIHRISDRSVTLDADSKTTHEGEFGLWLDEKGVHARIGRVIETDPSAGTVKREVLRLSGDASGATLGRWTSHVFAGPQDVDPTFGDIDLAVDGGTAPAWLFRPARPSGNVWSIHIHGINTTRVTALRTVPAALAAGHTVLVPSFRGDGDGPPTARGVSTLGQTEWRDVEAALAYAVDQGATSIVLVGWSMGATIALLLAERSSHRRLISRMVVVAPATNWRRVIRNGIARAKLPRFTGRLTEYALEGRALSKLVGLPEPLILDELEWGSLRRIPVPCLIIHSDGDTDVPFSLTQRFQDANPATVEVVQFPSAFHAWEYNLDSAHFDDVVTDWLTAA